MLVFFLHFFFCTFPLNEHSYLFTSEICESIKPLHKVFSFPVWLPRHICSYGQILGLLMMIFMMTTNFIIEILWLLRRIFMMMTNLIMQILRLLMMINIKWWPAISCKYGHIMMVCKIILEIIIFNIIHVGDYHYIGHFYDG